MFDYRVTLVNKFGMRTSSIVPAETAQEALNIGLARLTTTDNLRRADAACDDLSKHAGSASRIF